MTASPPRVRRALLTAALTAMIPATAAAQQADPADVESIESIIHAVYDVISGDAGEARDWDRWHTLFAEGATLTAVGRNAQGQVGRSLMTPESYPEIAGPSLMQSGFHEVEIHRVTERYGLIAHAFSTYESRYSASDPEPFTRGINSFQLMHDGSRWWVQSIFWQGESPDFPIPAEYTPGG